MLLIGNCIEQIKNIDSQSVQTCVTSPPYWGLRDYGTASWEGGDSKCAHKGKSVVSLSGTLTSIQKKNKGAHLVTAGDCQCGAIRVDKQIGLEETPEGYITNLVEVFSEVRRVLKDDGTLWLNLGDSYYNYRPGKGQSLPKQTVSKTNQDLPQDCLRRGNKQVGLKEKDLIGNPWRVAFALQADGWYLRQDIIWAKPNPMPESVKDRCTKSHEYLFLLSKSPKYYYDNEAIKEPAVTTEGRPSGVVRDRVYEYNSKQALLGRKRGGNITPEPITRNKRDVWTINTKPFKGAHFATMPEALVEPCVLAGSKEGDIVFDPFLGSGTVAVVAERHRRNWIGCELNPDYAAIAEARIASAQPEMELFEEGQIM